MFVAAFFGTIVSGSDSLTMTICPLAGPAADAAGAAGLAWAGAVCVGWAAGAAATGAAGFATSVGLAASAGFGTSVGFAASAGLAGSAGFAGAGAGACGCEQAVSSAAPSPVPRIATRR